MPWLIPYLYASGYDMRAIGSVVGMTCGGVSYLLRSRGIPTRSPGRPRK
jgi:hypothetical protein